ncbi:MAG: DUF4329 domain-containing protein [Arenicellales bacterium]
MVLFKINVVVNEMNLRIKLAVMLVLNAMLVLAISPLSAAPLSAIQPMQFDETIEQTSQFSVNQNRRLSASDGVSLDTILPSYALGKNTVVSGYTRLNAQEQHAALGLSVGANRFSLLTGQSQGFSRLSGSYSDIDPYYFHGGSRADYRFSNLEWARQINAKTELKVGTAQLRADHLAHRYTHYLGGNVGALNGHMMWVRRGDDVVGQALSVGSEFDLASGSGAFNWSMIKHRAGGEIQQLSLDFSNQSANQFNVSVHRQQNPLLDEPASQRIMFGIRRALGSNRFAAGENKDKRLNPKGWGYLAGGAVLMAALVSSGSDGQDSNVRLADQHAVGKRALNEINPVSVREKREYGGWVYRTPDDRYTFTKPIHGNIDSILLPKSLIPSGGQPLASFHTHGAFDPRYRSEEFSFADLANNQSSKVDGYLGTPGGKFLWHDHRKNRVINLGAIAK